MGISRSCRFSTEGWRARVTRQQQSGLRWKTRSCRFQLRVGVLMSLGNNNQMALEDAFLSFQNLKVGVLMSLDDNSQVLLPCCL